MKSKIKLIALTAASCLLLNINVAHAGNLNATQPEKVLSIAKGFGSARMKTRSNGSPMIVGRIDGTKYGIPFYGCNSDGEDCDDIQFAAAWAGVEVSMDDINEWNKTKRFGKAYIDNDGDPVLEMTVNLDYGVSEENFEDTFNWWKRILKEFKSEVLDI